MDLFIDSANLEEISEANKIGVIDGVTTNPSIISKENMATSALILKICNIVDGPVSVEVISLGVEDMFEESLKLASLHKNVVVKIPMTREGLCVVSQLSKKNIKTNVTLVFSAVQALLAAKVGATYISPFVGRLDDLSNNGINLIKNIMPICKKYETKVIVASVRSTIHILKSALFGANIATIPFNLISKMIHHPLTKIGLDSFIRDWEKSRR